jgi:hypothetical protein
VSSRKRSLTRGGISAASEAHAGGLCVTGKTSTRVSAGLAAGRSAATIAQGRSFDPLRVRPGARRTTDSCNG